MHQFYYITIAMYVFRYVKINVATSNI